MTEVEPVLAFVRSGFIEVDEDELRERVEREIAAQGFFHITRDTGLFRASRGQT